MSIMLVIFLVQFLGTTLDTYIPLIIDRVLKVATAWSGYFATATIIGAILGNILYPILHKTSMKTHHLYLYGIASLGLSIGLSGFILTPVYYLFMFFMVGVTGSLLGVWSFTEIQLLVDTGYLGRVFSILTMITLMSAPIAGVVFGGLADILYIPLIFKYISLLWLAIGIFSFFYLRKAAKQSPSKNTEFLNEI
jgi:DHA3 family macrolide efflux protein-like MFS transporter